MVPHFIELHKAENGKLWFFNINLITDFSDGVVETDRETFVVSETHEQIKELIQHCGCMIAKPDPRLCSKPLTWEQLTQPGMIGQPVFNSNTREWMLLIDSAGTNTWIELINTAGGHEKWIEHDAQARPLYRMAVALF